MPVPSSWKTRKASSPAAVARQAPIPPPPLRLLSPPPSRPLPPPPRTAAAFAAAESAAVGAQSTLYIVPLCSPDRVSSARHLPCLFRTKGREGREWGGKVLFKLLSSRQRFQTRQQRLCACKVKSKNRVHTTDPSAGEGTPYFSTCQPGS